MELRETIESINYKLERDFGKHIDDRPNFRVVFSEDQFEKRWTSYTDDGFELLHPEVRLLPKYKQFIHQKYVLERLVPTSPDSDLVEKVSYEPAWVFQNSKQEYLPPFYEGCRFVIESIMAAIGKANTHVKYRDPNISEEQRLENIKKVEQELFGNETDMTDNLHYGSGVGFTTSETLH